MWESGSKEILQKTRLFVTDPEALSSKTVISLKKDEENEFVPGFLEFSSSCDLTGMDTYIYTENK